MTDPNKLSNNPETANSSAKGGWAILESLAGKFSEWVAQNSKTAPSVESGPPSPENFPEKSAKRLCSALERSFTQPDFFENLLAASDNQIDTLYANLGQLLEYAIRTRDEDPQAPTLENLAQISERLAFFQGEDDIAAQKANTFDHGFLTHSCNGSFRKNIEQFGLGAPENRDDTVSADLDFLESLLGKSRYLDQQKNTADELYLSSPGANSIYYATTQSPERLFMGILNQERGTALPIRVGETRQAYYRRVLGQKLRDKGVPETEQITGAVDRVVDKFFSEDPIIVFVPMQSPHYRLKVSLSTTKSESPATDIADYIRDFTPCRGETVSEFFSQDPNGGWGAANNLDDLVSENTVIPPSDLGILRIPSRFDFLQMKAKNLGLQEGVEIDYFWGDPESPSHPTS